MPLSFILENLDALDENTKKLYKADADGKKFLLDVDGAVAKTDMDALQSKYDEAKALAYAEDGKSFKDMFDGSQKANKAIRDERDGFKSELEEFKKIGDLKEIQRLRDENTELKKSGKTLDEQQKELNALREQLREGEKSKAAFESQIADLQRANKELTDYKAKSEKDIDLAKAQAEISAVVETLKGANVKALSRHLLSDYQRGDLVRDARGVLVSATDKASLAVYAKDTMEGYNLYASSTAGISGPLPPGGAQQGAQDGPTTAAGLAAMFKM